MIREAMIQDLGPLALLFDAYRVFYKKESDVAGATAFLQQRLKKNESRIYVHETEEGALTGFVQLYPLFSSTRMCRLWLLNDLFVTPGHRGKGISLLLLDAAKRLARETDAAGLMLETAKSNLIGNALYPKAGFALDSDHNYYTWDTSL